MAEKIYNLYPLDYSGKKNKLIAAGSLWMIFFFLA